MASAPLNTSPENDHGVMSLLKNPSIYKLSQELLGAHQWRRKFLRELVQPKNGDKVVDIGCGPAQLLEWLPPVQYVGLDANTAYIEDAKKKYGNAGVFLVGNTHTLRGDPHFQKADIAMCCGVLHHLNDEDALDLIRFSHEILKPGGRFLALEAAYLPGQGLLSRWIVSKDRGMYVRTEDAYKQLAARCFSRVKTSPDLHPLRIPYAGLTLECVK
ncbi:MAG: class I SAM-dependent methyltransferase [Verrucomicrobiota bacterium]